MLLTWPLRHPRPAIVGALIGALLSVWAVSRMHSDASIDAMFSGKSDAARALVRIVNDFGAVDDLIVIAQLPSSRPGADPQALLAFARRLELEIARSPESAALAEAVLYRADAQTMEFFQKVLVPSAVFYLDDAAFAAAQDRLTAPQMRRQVEQDQAMLATPGPAASAMAKAFMQDPLRLRDFLLEKIAAQKPIRTYAGSDAFISEDGRNLLIRVRGKRPPSDLDFCTRFTRAVGAAAAGANSDGLSIELAGSYAIAAHSAKTIRSDMIASVAGSVICLQALFLLAYRRAIKLFALAVAPIALGVLLGFAGYSLAATGLTPLSAVLGGILAGMAIDYSIQYLTHYESRRAAGENPAGAARAAIVHITPAAFAAWLTSIIGFAAIGASSVKMLRDFALLGTLGLAGAFVAVVALMPMLLMLTDRRNRAASPPAILGRLDAPLAARSTFRIDLAPLLRWISAHARGCIIVSIAAVGVAIIVLLATPGELLPLESDLTVMHPRPNPALDAQAHLAQRFGIAPDSILVHLRAKSPDGLVALAHDADARLKGARGRAAGVSGTYGLASLLPDPRIARARRSAIGPAVADRVAADFIAVMADAGFNPAAKSIAEYAAFLKFVLTRTQPPAMPDLLPYRRLAETMLPRSAFEGVAATEAITLVFLRDEIADRAARDRAVEGIRSALAELPGATPTGLSVVGYDTEAAVRRDLPRLVWAAVIAVTLYLAFHFRSARLALLAMLPTAFSLVVLLAAMRLAGQKLNMINLVAIPLLIGIDVDYGVFLVSLARDRNRRGQDQPGEERAVRLAPVCHAVMMCAAATIIGFGSLAGTSVPAVRSLGFAVAVGIGACLFAALFLVVPLFLSVSPRAGPHDHAHTRE